MSVLVDTVIRKVRTTLNDMTLVRWSEQEHVDAINDAQDAVLVALPHIFEDYRDITLVEGNEQSIPSDCYMLLDVLWNINADATQGKRITRVERSMLDRHRAAWSESGESETVRHWAQDVGEKAKFYVAPRQPVGVSHEVHVRVAKRPADVSSSASSIGVPDEYENALYYFAVARLLEKDEKFAGSPQAQAFWQKFAAATSAAKQGEQNTDELNRGNEDM